MKSMTAYVQLEKEIEGMPVTFELKSYNSRYLDIKINVPFWLSPLEQFIREYFTPNILRGSVEMYLSAKGINSQSDFSFDLNIAKKYNDALTELASNLNITYSPNIEYLASLPGVAITQENVNLEKWKTELIPLFDLALYSFNEAKKTEGEICQANIEKQITIIDDAVTFIENERINVESLLAKNLKEKFDELVGSNYDEMRILQEVAVLLNKYTIEEELVRLQAHLSAIKVEIPKEGAISKRLDFICQEMNREINTIASKNQSYKIAEQAVLVKEAIENIREQLKNLE